MIGSMVIEVPTKGSVITSLFCLNCHRNIFGRSFGMDLVGLTLDQLNVILRIKWFEFKCVHINCYNKTTSFMKIEEEEYMLVSAKQVREFLKDEALVFVASLNVNGKPTVADIPVVCDFPEVFLDDICDLPLGHKVEFTIDLVPDTSLMYMTPYRMYAS